MASILPFPDPTFGGGGVRLERSDTPFPEQPLTQDQINEMLGRIPLPGPGMPGPGMAPFTPPTPSPQLPGRSPGGPQTVNRTQPPQRKPAPLTRQTQGAQPQGFQTPEDVIAAVANLQGMPLPQPSPGPFGQALPDLSNVQAAQQALRPQGAPAATGAMGGTTGGETTSDQTGGDQGGVPSQLTPDFFFQSVQGFAPNADGLRQWWSQVGSQIPGLGFIDHPTDPAIVLPDGTQIDAIQNAGTPNAVWQWLVKGGGRGGGQGGSRFGGGGPGGFQGGGNFGGVGVPGVSGVGLPEQSFDDPATRFLEDFVRFRLGELFQPVEDPNREQLASLLQSRIESLQEPPFTAGEESALRTRSQDEIERQRAAAQRNALERLASRGFEESSGLVEQSAQDIDRQFGGLRAQESAQFGQFGIQERQRRLNQAMQVADALAQVSFAARQEEEARRGQALSLAGLLTELPERRLQLALATLGQTQPPGSLFNSLAAMAGIQQGQQGLGLQQQSISNAANQNFGLGLAGLIPSLFPQGTPGGTTG